MDKHFRQQNLGLFESHAKIAHIWNWAITFSPMDYGTNFRFRSNFIFLAEVKPQFFDIVKMEPSTHQID